MGQSQIPPAGPVKRGQDPSPSWCHHDAATRCLEWARPICFGDSPQADVPAGLGFMGLSPRVLRLLTGLTNQVGGGVGNHCNPDL